MKFTDLTFSLTFELDPVTLVTLFSLQRYYCKAELIMPPDGKVTFFRKADYLRRCR